MPAPHGPPHGAPSGDTETKRPGDSNTRERTPCGRPDHLQLSPEVRTGLEEAESCLIRTGGSEAVSWQPSETGRRVGGGSATGRVPGVPAETDHGSASWTSVAYVDTG